MLPKGGDFGVSFCGHWDDHWVFGLLDFWVFPAGFRLLITGVLHGVWWMDMPERTSEHMDRYLFTFQPDSLPTMNSYHVTVSRDEPAFVFFPSQTTVTFASRWQPSSGVSKPRHCTSTHTE